MVYHPTGILFNICKSEYWHNTLLHILRCDLWSHLQESRRRETKASAHKTCKHAGFMVSMDRMFRTRRTYSVEYV